MDEGGEMKGKRGWEGKISREPSEKAPEAVQDGENGGLTRNYN